LESWDAARVQSLREMFRRELKRLGVPDEQMAHALERVSAALSASLADTRGRWVLAAHRNEHDDARAELRLTGLVAGDRVDIVIDRTFIDAQGVRWIVD